MGEYDLDGTDPLLVAGAGPVGLTAALALRARGRRVAVLEAGAEDRVRPGSRAIYLHGATLRVLERLSPGLGHELARGGVVWPTRRTVYRGREVFRRTYTTKGEGRDGLPHFTSLPQVEAERMMLGACKRAGVEFLWSQPVERVETSSALVSVTTGRGTRLEAPYLVGADGARSVVREQIGIEMEGSRSVNSFIIADVAENMDDPLPVERVFHYEHPAVGGRNVLLVPFAGGWRADLQLRVEDDPEHFSRGEGLQQWIGATLGPKYSERLTWVSTYQFLQVIAHSYIDRHARVLLVGEAAHLFAPFGARGMNSGVPDADAAAAAIDAALDADDEARRAAAIERFAQERREAAEWNRRAAGLALRHMQALDAGARMKRSLAALLSRFSEKAGEWLDTAPYGPTAGPPSARQSKY